MKIINKYVVDVYKVSFKALNDTFKSVFKFLGVKSLMNKLSLKSRVFTLMHDFLNSDFSPISELRNRVYDVEKQIENDDLVDDEHIEDIVRNMDLVYEHDLMNSYEVDDKIADALEGVEHDVEPISLTQMEELKSFVIERVLQKIESKKSPTIKEVEQNQKNMKLAFNLMLAIVTKKDDKQRITISNDTHKLVYDLLDNYLNGGTENMNK